MIIFKLNLLSALYVNRKPLSCTVSSELNFITAVGPDVTKGNLKGEEIKLQC